MNKQYKNNKSKERKKNKSILIQNQINVQGNITIGNVNKISINNYTNQKIKEKENINMKESNKIISQLRDEFEQIKRGNKKKIYDNYIPALTEEESQNKRIRSINSSILDPETEKEYLDYFQTKINSKRVKNKIESFFHEENDLNCINKQITFSIHGIYNKEILENKIKELENTIKFLALYINDQKTIFINNINKIVRNCIDNILKYKLKEEKRKNEIILFENHKLKNILFKLYDSINEYNEKERKIKKRECNIISQLLKENEYLRKIMFIEKEPININDIKDNKFDFLKKDLENKKKKRISKIEEEIKLLVESDKEIIKPNIKSRNILTLLNSQNYLDENSDSTMINLKLLNNNNSN